jgi:uncharacterized membrane protein YccC
MAASGLPPWLAHPLRFPRQPVPWQGVLRGALGIGPLLALGLAAGAPALGVLAGVGALLATVADRPGSRRAASHRLGLPALCGALGMAYGSAAGAVGAHGWWSVAVLALAGLVAGALGAIGPVSSSAGTQFLIAAILGTALPLAASAPLRAVLYLCGGVWVIGLRVLLPTGRRFHLGYLLDGEREAVAAAYDAVADALAAAGGPAAEGARLRLTQALDRAQEALAGPWSRRPALRPLRRRLGAVLGLAEAATALLWEGRPVPPRALAGPRRLALAVRTGAPCGPLPSTAAGSDPGLRALDAALLAAAEAFGGGAAHEPPPPRARPREALRRAFGPAGREYGFRVSLCTAAADAAAQALHPAHAYWLPVTAAFLVKPDLGPLVSRVLCRAAGTAVGALAFAGLAALLPGGWWPLALAALCGALIPVATRHFALQTVVVTMLVLCLLLLFGGEAQAAWPRLQDTLLACALVLIVGHLPLPGGTRPRVAVRLAAAARAAQRYLEHVAYAPGERQQRVLLRRDAYRALSEARAAVDLAAAELPALAAPVTAWGPAVSALERVVDATTACAVRLDAGARQPARPYVAGLTRALAALGAGEQASGDLREVPGCGTLTAVAAELKHALAITTAA